MPKRAVVDASPRPDKVSHCARSHAREKPTENDMGEPGDAWEDEVAEEGSDRADGAMLL